MLVVLIGILGILGRTPRLDQLVEWDHEKYGSCFTLHFHINRSARVGSDDISMGPNDVTHCDRRFFEPKILTRSGVDFYISTHWGRQS